MTIHDTPSTPEASPAAPGDAGDVAMDDSIYDAAMSELLSDDGAPSVPQEPDSTPPAAEPARTDGALAWGALSDQDRQTLQRSRIDQPMFESWSDDQRRSFLDHQSKRERDQTDSYRDLSEQNARLQRQLEERDAAIDRGDVDPEETPLGLDDSVNEVIEDLVDTYGEEMRPLQRAFSAMQERLQGLERHGQAAPVMSRMIAELTMKSAISDLAQEYPSLQKPDARKSIEEKFAQRWQNSPHRKDTDKPMMERISATLRDIAGDEFGNVTEAAAAASLINRSRDRLGRQPVVGHGKGRPAPLTDDDIMDQAFEETMAPAIRERY